MATNRIRMNFHNRQNNEPARIMIVDDIPANLKLLTEIVAGNGYRVRPASSGQLALRSVAIEAPDMILLDVMMPDMDGYEVCRRLKADGKSRSIPVIFISALDEVANKIKGFEAGGVDYITKPFQPLEVLKRIETHLSLQRLQKQLEAQNIQLQREIAERWKSEEELKEHESHLEELIAERTADLQQEIRERGRVEETLRESEKRLFQIIDFLPDATFAIDSDGKILAWNRAIEEMTGIKAEEMVGKGDYEYSVPFYGVRRPILIDLVFSPYEEIKNNYYYIREGKQCLFSEAEVPVKGERRTLWGIARPLFDSKGNITGAIESIRDITERKLTELTVREVNERFHTLVNTIPDLIWLKNSDGVYLSCNKMFERFFGAKEADIVGKTDYDFVERKLADFFREHDRNAMAAGKPSNNEEWIIFADDGHRALLYTTKTPMHDAEGTLIGVLGIGRDITELKRSEEELARHREHLEVLVKERTAQLEVAMTNLSLARDAANAANQAKSMFLANMSHEIRTPMNAVLGFAQLLQRDPSLSPQARNKVATILKSGEHLLSIINDILEMSRIEAGRVEMRPQIFDLSDLLDDLAVMFRLRAEEKGLAFSTEVAPDLPRYIMADIGKLRQVLINLLGNAVKFTNSGSIQLRAFPVTIDRIGVEVKDTGIGISPEEIEKLFHPFGRTISGERTAGGTGLGLAISRKYAHMMGGEIAVESVEGAGSRFRFECHAPPAIKEPVVARTQRRVIGLAPAQGEIRVLVADDQRDNRELLRWMLAPLGFVVDEVADGEEAVKKALELKPRIILMDLIMPGMDGAEATRVLRTSYTKESLAIIGITASAFDKQKQQFLDAGINAFLSKPFRDRELYDMLSAHAGVSFITEGNETALVSSSGQEIPRLDKMPDTWREAFGEALARKNITRIRKLGEEAEQHDPALSSWLLERAGLYDLDGLKKLSNDHEKGGHHG